jgi:RimJ/RimL family protein N-acetyltransferase
MLAHANALCLDVNDHTDVSFDFEPVLSGALLKLRPLRADDYPALSAAAADPRIWEQHPAKDRYREEVFRGFFDQHLSSGGAFVVIDAVTGEVVGTSRFHGYDSARSEIEIGWTFLARSHWGGTYNRELKHLMLRHAFRFVESVVFLVDPQNVRSQRAVEKIGGIRVGLRLDGGGRESIAYRIVASQFDQLP